MRKLACLCMAGIAAVMLTACSSIVSDMNEGQKNIVAEYAADIMLKYDRHYSDRYMETEPLTEEETFDRSIEDDTAKNNNTQQGGEPSSEQGGAQTYNTIEQILGLEGFSVTYKDYQLTESYPSEKAENALFVMQAVENSRLLVVKLAVTNTSGKKQKLDVMNYDARYQLTVNESSKLNAQITLLLDAFNTYEGSFGAGETKELVLIFQTKEQKKADIKNLQLKVSCKDQSGKITLK